MQKTAKQLQIHLHNNKYSTEYDTCQVHNPGLIGFTNSTSWVISSGGKWVQISGSTASWTESNRSTQPLWSGTNWAHLALLRESGVEFNRAEVVTPQDLAGWPSPVSGIDKDVYVLYLSKDLSGLNLNSLIWNTSKPFMYTDVTDIYVQPQANPIRVQENIPEEFGHIPQQINDPWFKAKYIGQWVIHGGPFWGNSGYRNNPYEIEAKTYLDRILRYRKNPSAGP